MPKSSIHNGRAFDAGLAALAAVSAGFVVFAMPEPVFSGLIEASHLPDFVPASSPPLGETARLIVIAAVALLTFGAVWALMAALGRVPAKPAAANLEPEAEAPRLRRADAHPDAPARRPLLASDLGEPLELEELAEPFAEEAPYTEPAGPLPGFLIPQPETLEEPEPEPEPEAQTEPESDPEPLPLAELAAQLPDSGEEADQSLSQLVNRIEFGLSRKRQALPAAELPVGEQAPADQERVGHRLRSAINDLQKIASSGGA